MMYRGDASIRIKSGKYYIRESYLFSLMGSCQEYLAEGTQKVGCLEYEFLRS